MSSSKAELALPVLDNGQLAFLLLTRRHERLFGAVPMTFGRGRAINRGVCLTKHGPFSGVSRATPVSLQGSYHQ
jgi:hypothetical protein